MSDIEVAIKSLEGHTIALVKDDIILTSDERGVAPMVGFIKEGKNLCGFSVADKVVGKAAAMLFIKAKIKEVYAENISAPAEKILSEHGIPFTFKNEAPYIVNHDNTGMCPMESAVLNTDDIDDGVRLIFEKLDFLKNANNLRK